MCDLYRFESICEISRAATLKIILLHLYYERRIYLTEPVVHLITEIAGQVVFAGFHRGCHYEAVFECDDVALDGQFVPLVLHLAVVKIEVGVVGAAVDFEGGHSFGQQLLVLRKTGEVAFLDVYCNGERVAGLGCAVDCALSRRHLRVCGGGDAEHHCYEQYYSFHFWCVLD